MRMIPVVQIGEDGFRVLASLHCLQEDAKDAVATFESQNEPYPYEFRFVIGERVEIDIDTDQIRL